MIHSVKSWKSTQELEAIIRNKGLVEIDGLAVVGGENPKRYSGSVHDIPYGTTVVVKRGKKSYQFSKHTDGGIYVE